MTFFQTLLDSGSNPRFGLKWKASLRLGLGKFGPFCLWLKRLKSFAWNYLSLVDVTIMALEFIFASETVVAAVFASKDRTWELCRVGAVLDEAMALEISEFIGLGLASFLPTVVGASFAEVRALVLGKVRLDVVGKPPIIIIRVLPRSM